VVYDRPAQPAQTIAIIDNFDPGTMRTYEEPQSWPLALASESIWLLAKQNPETGSQTIPTFDWFDLAYSDGFGALADDQICVNGSILDLVRRCRGRKLDALLTLSLSAHPGSK
jgi:hypothetical protein